MENGSRKQSSARESWIAGRQLEISEAAGRVYIEWIKRRLFFAPDEPEPALVAAIDKMSQTIEHIEHVEIDEVEESANWVERRIEAGGREGWTLLRDVVRLAPDDGRVLSLIGAGIFETWVSEERVREFLGELELELQREPKLRQVVLASWDIPPSLQPILQRIGCWGVGPG